MYKKQPCDDANEDMKINGRRTKTLLYLSRIFCFTGVALLWRRIYISFWDLSDWQIVQVGHYGQFMTAAEPLSAPEGWFGVWIDWKKMFHLFISSLQIIRMTIRPRHNSWGVMSAITRRISPLGQNRDKTRLQMRDTEKTIAWVSPSGRKIDINSLKFDNDTLETKNSLYQSRFIFHHNVQF